MDLLQEYRVGDMVKPTTGVHKGEIHKIIGIHENGRISVKPHMLPRDRVKYRLGAALAHYTELEPINEGIQQQEVRVDRRRNATVVVNGRRATHAVRIDRRKPLRAKPLVKRVRRDANDLRQELPKPPMPLPVSDLTQIKSRRY